MPTRTFPNHFAIALCVCLALLISAAMPAHAVSTTVVISQVYGGGGNSGAQYKNDFIELHNVSSSPISVTGWSVQYASASGTSWATTNLTGTIPAGGYFLVQEAAGSGNGTSTMPTPDVAGGAINMSATAGKVALVSSTTALSGACPSSSSFVDFVGFGSTANCSEGSPTAAPSNTTSAQRAGSGCTENDNNSTDFAIAAPAPRNSATTALICTGDPVRTNPSGSGVATPNAIIQNIMTTVLSVTVAPGQNPDSTGIAVTGDLSSIAGSATQTFTYDATNHVYSFSTTVPDTVGTGSKSLPITITDAEGRNGSTTIALTVSAPAPPYAIHEVQGNGNASPLVGQRVMVSGIVTAVTGNNFYLEAPDSAWDGFPETSEGVFVYAGSKPTGAVVGDSVQVHGTVQEYAAGGALTTTEIGSPTVIVLSQGNTLPTAVEMTPDPNGKFFQLERYEGMLVHFGSSNVVGPTGVSGSKSDGLFYAVSDTLSRPRREPGVQDGIALPSGMPANYPIFDGNPERVLVDTSSCGTPANVGVGDRVSDMTGPLGYTGDFTVYACPTITLNQKPAAALSVRAANEFTVATFNMLNFTNNAGRIAKVSLAIRKVMQSPDVIGVEEMNNLSTLQALAAQINLDAVADGQANPGYTAQLLAPPATQNVGFLYRTDRLTDVNVVQVGDTEKMPDGKNVLNDRPPLVMTAKIVPPAGKPYPVTIIVNHLRSLISVDVVDVPPSTTGDFARTKRKLGAEYLANLIKQHEDAGETVIAVGDFNAYDFNDGYVDVLGTVTGHPAAEDQVLLASTDLYGSSPHPVDLATTLPEDQRYSYVEVGNTQMLDHIVVSPGLLNYPYHLEVAHNNAEYPGLLANDTSRSERVSDHDMPVAYFTVATTVPTVTPASLTFPATTVGLGSSSKMVTVTNSTGADMTVTPSATGDFMVSGNTCTGIIAATAQCNIWVRFTPTTGGTRSGTFTINYSGQTGPVNVNLSGTGSAQVVLGATSLNFPGTTLGAGSSSLMVTLLNRTGVPISVTPSITGEFMVSANNCPASLLANSGCAVWVRFTPKTAGALAGNLNILAGGISQDVALSGTGAGSITLNKTAMAFGSVAVGQGSSSQMVTLFNNSGVGITVSPSIDVADFMVSGNSCTGTVAAGGTQCNIWVRFTPKSVNGLLSGTLTINANGNPVGTVSLSGSGN
jgi:predicted extracellular nuclease